VVLNTGKMLVWACAFVATAQAGSGSFGRAENSLGSLHDTAALKRGAFNKIEVLQNENSELQVEEEELAQQKKQLETQLKVEAQLETDLQTQNTQLQEDNGALRKDNEELKSLVKQLKEENMELLTGVPSKLQASIASIDASASTSSSQPINEEVTAFTSMVSHIAKVGHDCPEDAVEQGPGVTCRSLGNSEDPGFCKSAAGCETPDTPVCTVGILGQHGCWNYEEDEPRLGDTHNLTPDQSKLCFNRVEWEKACRQNTPDGDKEECLSSALKWKALARDQCLGKTTVDWHSFVDQIVVINLKRRKNRKTFMQTVLTNLVRIPEMLHQNVEDILEMSQGVPQSKVRFFDAIDLSQWGKKSFTNRLLQIFGQDPSTLLFDTQQTGMPSEWACCQKRSVL
jgi:hypothetical protein